MNQPTKEQLKEALEFVMEAMVSYTNSLDKVVRKPFAAAVQHHMQVIAMSTQQEPDKKETKKT